MCPRTFSPCINPVHLIYFPMTLLQSLILFCPLFQNLQWLTAAFSHAKLLGLLLQAHLLLHGDLLFSFVRVKTSFYAHESCVVTVVHRMILSRLGVGRGGGLLKAV